MFIAPLKQNIKSCNDKEKVKTTRTVKKNQNKKTTTTTTTIGLISKKGRAAHFFVHFFAVVLHDHNVKFPETSLSYTFYGENVVKSCSFFFSLLLIFTLVTVSISYFLTAAIKILCLSFSEIGVSCCLILTLALSLFSTLM